MYNNAPCDAIDIKDSKYRKKRIDSIGTPESPFKILLLNLLKKNKEDLDKKKNLYV